MKTKKITIAIDGFSSTGKSTIAKELAKYLKYIYVDTGAMYRAVTYFAMKNGMIGKDYFDTKNLIDNLDKIKIEFRYDPYLASSQTYLNGENVEGQIRSIEVSDYVSRVAELSEIRKKLVEQQQKIGKDKGVVMDGRDIGTVVFPKAELKLFIVSDANIRAKRRYDELVSEGKNVTFEKILENILQRDHIDTHRKDSPLTKSQEAIEINNSYLTKKEQFDRIVALVRTKVLQF